MKIFVTGGTGLIGQELTGLLLEKGHEVSILTRNPKNINKNFVDKIKVIQGDPSEEGEWQKQITGHDAVVNLVGANIISRRWSGKRKKSIYDSRVKPKENIAVTIQREDNTVRVFISPSGVDYYPPDDTKVFTEDDKPGSGYVADLCIDWEINSEEMKKNNIRGINFRFGLAFTKTGKGAERMFLSHRLFVGGWLGNGKQPFSWVHIDDMVGAIIWGLETEEIVGTFNVVGDDMVTNKEIGKAGGKILHRWTWAWVPGILLKMILGERSQLLLKGRHVSNEKIKTHGYKFKFANLNNALIDVL